MTGTVSGIALTPGVSLNGRLYTKEAVTKAYARMAARISDPNGSPIVMRTHHAAGDDSTRIVAQVDKVSQDADGTIRYEGSFADTPHAQTIRELAKPNGGKPNLAHVSIYGWWASDPVTKVMEDGRKVETADDFEIDAIDFTSSPGVVTASASAESHRGNVIHESYEAEITVTEASTAEITEPAKAFADPGYMAGAKKWPLGTAAETVTAWCAVNTPALVEAYTGPQVKRMKTRVKTAAKKTGAVIADAWLYNGAPLSEKLEEYYADYYGYDVETGNPPATFCFDATNGPIRVSISSYCIDPADLEVVTRAAVDAISVALKSLDPDMDGDIDLAGAPGEAGDDGLDQMETAAETAPNTSATTAEATATEVAQTSEESDVAETATETTKGAATEAAPAADPAPAGIDTKTLAETVIAIMDARDAAKAKAAETAEDDKAKAETAAAEAETQKAALAEGLKDVVRELLVEGGVKTPGRKGFALTEQTEAASDELWEKRALIIGAAARENRMNGA